MVPRFRDRQEAGRQLADKLAAYADQQDVSVLALPRGGVPVAFEVATALHVPLDVFVVRKLGVPDHEELAMGAIASGGVVVRNEEVIFGLGIPSQVFDLVLARERQELERRERLYRGEHPFPELAGRRVILVDDGLATGATMRAAVAALRQHRPSRCIVAVPVAPPDTCEDLRAEVDEVVCLMTPEPFYAVGLWYEQFPQLSDEQVRHWLAQARQLQWRWPGPRPQQEAAAGQPTE
jgi:predicted phosphoribosyltransferase